MKRLALAVLLMQTTFLLGATKPNPADYTITVHVIGSQGGSSVSYQHLEVIIDGQSLELQGTGYSNTRTGVLALGDYKAKTTKGVNPPGQSNGHDLFGAYKFLFPDGTTRYYEVIGLGGSGPASTPAASNP